MHATNQTPFRKFIRTSSLLPIVALAAVATAAPGALEARTDSSCNTGPISCCNNTYTTAHSPYSPDCSASSSLASMALSVSGAPRSLVWERRAPSSPCCTGNTFNGLIDLGCSPINVVL
ncbi:hydrophobin [Melanogaster broomeanus]|nr:hydrophobin [Melanogaster broomeanus]